MNAQTCKPPIPKSAPIMERMFAHFLISVTPEIGAMQRLLGTVRRRGFTIDSMMATLDSTGPGYRIELRLASRQQSNLSFETLARQIARNLDVVSVSMMSPNAALELEVR